MVTDSLAPCDTVISANMVLAMQEKRSWASKRLIYLCFLRVRKMTEIAKVCLLCLLR